MIWLYTGYEWKYIFDNTIHYHFKTQEKLSIGRLRRQKIIALCDVLVDGQFEMKKSDISYPFAGSTNQRVIDVEKSLSKGEVTLWNINM